MTQSVGYSPAAKIFRRAACEQAHRAGFRLKCEPISASLRSQRWILSTPTFKPKRAPTGALLVLAEGVGFEPT